MAQVVVRPKIQPPYIYQEFPRMVYGPQGETRMVNSAGEVPKGWSLHPDKPAKAPPRAPSVPATNAVGDEQDASGLLWNPALNTADKGKTAGGLWKMLPGKKRPKFDL